MEMSLIFFEFRNDFFVSSCRFEIRSQDLLEAKVLVNQFDSVYGISHVITCHAFFNSRDVRFDYVGLKTHAKRVS